MNEIIQALHYSYLFMESKEYEHNESKNMQQLDKSMGQTAASESFNNNAILQRENATTIYVQSGRYKGKQKLKCIMPLTEFVLMRVLMHFEKYLNHLYTCRHNNEKETIYVQFQKISTSRQWTIIINKELYIWEDYKKCKEEGEWNEILLDSYLCKYIWLKSTGEKCLFEWLSTNLFEFAYLNNDYLIDISNQNQEQVNQKLEKISVWIKEKVPISKFLRAELNEKSKGLVKQLEFIQSQMKNYKVNEYTFPYAKNVFLFESKNTFDILRLREKLLQNNIKAQFIGQQEFHLCKKVLGSLARKEKQGIDLKLKDVTYIDRVFNNTQNCMSKKIQFVTQNWEMYSPFMESHIENLQNDLDYYTQSEAIYSELFPSIKGIAQKCERISEYKGTTVSIQKKGDNSLFETFVSATREGTLDETIMQQDVNILGKVDRLKSLFNRVTDYHHINNTQINENISLSWQSIQRNQHDALMGLQCLGCYPYFYYKTKIDDSVIKEANTFIFGRVQEINDDQVSLGKQMKRLMEGFGGIILFDCQFNHLQVKPHGCPLTQERRKKISAEIKIIFETLLVKDQKTNIEKTISITFVPVVAKDTNNEKNIAQVKDLFVTRVKIERRPTVMADSLLERQSWFFQSKVSCFHEGDCLQPMKFPQYERPQKKKKKLQKPEQEDQQGKYSFASVVVSNDFAWNELKQMLETSYKEGSPFKLTFQLYKSYIKTQEWSQQKMKQFFTNCYLLYHNPYFEQIKSTLKSEARKRKNAKQQLILIKKIELFICLESQNLDYRVLMRTYKEQFEQDDNDISLWRFQYALNKFQYYLQASSARKSLFLLSYLKHKTVKPRFQLPKGYECFNHSDFAQKFKLVQPEKSPLQQSRLKNKLYQKFKSLSLRKKK